MAIPSRVQMKAQTTIPGRRNEMRVMADSTQMPLAEAPIEKLPPEILHRILMPLLVREDNVHLRHCRPIPTFLSPESVPSNSKTGGRSSDAPRCSRHNYLSQISPPLSIQSPRVLPNNGPSECLVRSRNSIFLSCRSLYFAAIDIYYSSNTFQFDGLPQLSYFIHSTETDRKAHIQEVRLVSKWSVKEESYLGRVRWTAAPYSSVSSLESGTVVLWELPNLKKMIFNVTLSLFSVEDPSEEQCKEYKQGIDRQIRSFWSRNGVTVEFEYSQNNYRMLDARNILRPMPI